ncbi:hypothetical protein F0A16_09585 [Salinicola corii]|uniref:DUF5343 domain-containing protein n=1 Tax=Salinicola corii TaxID=2606937 RepID=A0A640WF03_9GAMM|nr:DUF5343 domain-containing protein [Salinicola corii]KAA0018745.1 hypothetical protein F0A16_09585 [Salinicola corii]
MGLPSTYTNAYGKLGEFFHRLRDGQAPERFTQEHLKDLGYTSKNHRAFIPIMKSLGFLTPDGQPTNRYNEYRSHSSSQRVMAEALKDAYSDIFLIKSHPTPADKPAIEGKFKSYHNVSDSVAKIMTSTFFALLNLADLNALNKSKPVEPENASTEDQQAKPESGVQPPVLGGLHYNIQIHLPATKDVEVYNAIFKSLKENLY